MAQLLRLPVPLLVKLCEVVLLTVSEPVAEPLRLAVPLPVKLCEPLLLTVTVADAVSDCDSVALALLVGQAENEAQDV